MKICFMGGQTAGLIGILTCKAIGHEILSAVVYDNGISQFADKLGIEKFDNIKSSGFVESCKECDILLSVHGREIVSNKLLLLNKIAAINVHPYLYAYKGSDSIGRAIKDKNWHASVECHRMTETLDTGELISSRYIEVEPSEIRAEIYNQLYPCYSIVIIEALRKLENEYISNSECPDILIGGWGLGYP